MKLAVVGRVVVGVSLPALLLAGCGKSADDHIKAAQSLAARNQLGDAAFEYRLALQAAPKRGDVRLTLGDLYMRMGQPVDALREYVRAADLLPRNIDAQLRAGYLLLLAAKFEDAKARAQRVLDLDPKNVDAQILLGNALAGLKNVDGALAQYQDAIALNPDRDSAYMSVGTIQAVRGNRAEAEAAFRRAVAVAPKSVAARLALGNFLWAAGRMTEAEQTFKDALAIAPEDVTANRAVAVLLLATRRTAEAEPYLKQMAKLSNTPASKISLADYYAFLGRFDDAKALLQALLSDNASYAVAMTRLAAIDATQGNRSQALDKVHQVLAKHPTESNARMLGARLLFADNKLDEALTEAQSLVQQDPSAEAAAEAYLLIGGVMSQRDQTNDAIAAYQEVLKRRPQSVDALCGLASLSLATGATDKALEFADHARTLQSRNPLARSLFVRALLAKHDLAKAEAETMALVKDFPKSSTAMNLLAQVQQARGQASAARTSYAKALEFDHQNLEAVEGIVRLDLASGQAQEATRRVQAVLNAGPPNGDLLMLAAQTYSAAGDQARAEELLRKAIDYQPSRMLAYGLLGELYFRQHRLNEARAKFQQIFDRDQRSVAAGTMIAVLLEMDNRLPEAELQYQKVLAIDPHAAVAANNLAWRYAVTNRNLDQALQFAQVAYQQMPKEPRVTDTLGWVYCKKNNPSAAVPYLEASVKAAPDEPEIHYHLGMAYFGTGEMEAARKELQHAVDSGVMFDGLPEAKRTLAQVVK
jgi:tetratricopeptide (TPR) repeat protein